MSPGASSFWIAPILPFSIFILGVGGLSRHGRFIARVAVAALAGSAMISGLGLFAAARGTRAVVALPWLLTGERRLELALWLDPLSTLTATLVSVIGLIVFIYAVHYLSGDPNLGRFFAELSLFIGAMLTLVLAADLLTLFIAWELVGLSSYLLIGFWFEKPGVPSAATKAFITTRIGDLALLAGILLLLGTVGRSRIDAILAAVAEDRLAPGLRLTAAWLLFAGATGKSAQVPLHGWLPDAMVGPTPVSALLHSATMVAAGVFLIARLYPLFLTAGSALWVMVWVGVITALLGAAAALVETDLKRTLAYSTLSQLGLMFVGLGSGSLLAGMLLLVAQALYKALLFLAAGAVDHAVEGTAFKRMGGLARRMPCTFIAFAIGAAALAGLPVTLALPPKDPVLAAAWGTNPAAFVLVLLASFLTALYSARALGLVFLGAPSEPAKRAYEAPSGLLAPMLALAGLVVMGLLGNAERIDRPLSRFLGTETPQAGSVTALALVVAAAGTVLGLWARRIWRTEVIWPPLNPAASLLAGEFGLKRLYRVLPQLGFRTIRRVNHLDRAFFDPMSAGLARVARGIVGGVGNLDRAILDAAVTRGVAAVLAILRTSARVDLHRVDASFNAFGRALLAAGQRLRGLQTGRIENYLLGIFVWGLGAIILAVLAMILS